MMPGAQQRLRFQHVQLQMKLATSAVCCIFCCLPFTAGPSTMPGGTPQPVLESRIAYYLAVVNLVCCIVLF
jgi:hypothetical protein